MIVLGIDPGVTGGLAWLYPDGKVVAIDIPTVAGEVDVDMLAGKLQQFRPGMAVVERASSMPKQGVASTFKYGVAYGALRAVVAVLEIPQHLVTPRKWKNHFRLDSDKEKSRALAIRLWPGCGYFSRKKDHGRAEAALIARYGAEVIQQSYGIPAQAWEQISQPPSKNDLAHWDADDALENTAG